MKRRGFLYSVCALLAAVLTGCGDAGTGGNATAAANRGGTAAGGGSGEQVTLFVSIPAATHGWPAGVGWWAEETRDQLRAQYPQLEIQLQRASRADEQSAQIDTMLQRGIHGLVVLPFDSDTPLTAIQNAKRQGAFVVSVDRGLRRPVADLYIAGDNRAFGRQSAQYMVERLNGQGRIVILRGMPVEIDTERYEAAMEVFNQHEGIEVLGAQPGNWSQSDAYQVMQAFLARHPQIDAVWASDDDMALGVERAIREAGRAEEMWILGGAGMKDIVRRVGEGDAMFPADITYPPGMIAAGIHAAAAALLPEHRSEIIAGTPDHLGLDETAMSQAIEQALDADEQQSLTLDVHLVTPDNAERYYFPDSVY